MNMVNGIQKYTYYFVVNLLNVLKVSSVTCPNNGISTTVSGQTMCYWRSTIKGTATNVHNNCASNGGRLALINSDAGRIAAETIVNQFGLDRTFIGVRRSQYNNNKFVTWLEESQSYFRWDWARNYWGQQPGNTNEKCVTMIPKYWHDDYCSRNLYGICSMSASPCDSNPCLNGGTCNNVGATIFTCECPLGYSGVVCEYNVYPCDSQPCLNGGTCNNIGLTSFSCICTTDYNGVDCSHRIMPCDSSPCLNDATCTNIDTSLYQCTCGTGYIGTHCEYKENSMRVEGNATIQPLGGVGACLHFRWFQDNRTIQAPINTTTNTDLHQCIRYCSLDYLDCSKVAYNGVTNTCLIGNANTTNVYASGFKVYIKV